MSWTLLRVVATYWSTSASPPRIFSEVWTCVKVGVDSVQTKSPYFYLQALLENELVRASIRHDYAVENHPYCVAESSGIVEP